MSSSFLNSEEVTTAFLRFKDFLNQSWSSVNAILVEHDWVNAPYLLEDWLDANWKYLFVRQVLGQEDNFQPLSISLNEIKKNQNVCQLHLEAPIEGVFISIGTINDGFSIRDPFDQVKMMDTVGDIHIVPLSSVKFVIRK